MVHRTRPTSLLGPINLGLWVILLIPSPSPNCPLDSQMTISKCCSHQMTSLSFLTEQSEFFLPVRADLSPWECCMEKPPPLLAGQSHSGASEPWRAGGSCPLSPLCDRRLGRAGSHFMREMLSWLSLQDPPPVPHSRAGGLSVVPLGGWDGLQPGPLPEGAGSPGRTVALTHSRHSADPHEVTLLVKRDTRVTHRTRNFWRTCGPFCDSQPGLSKSIPVETALQSPRPGVPPLHPPPAPASSVGRRDS